MSAATLLNACAACGAEESLESLLQRMVDDEEVRHLVAEIVIVSLPLGVLVVRYLRLHKPPSQRLRMSHVAKVLGELLPDMQRAAITRRGREWQAGIAVWKSALEAVFDARAKGTLKTPLEGNGYLYEVVMRTVDRLEAEAEKAREAERRERRPPRLDQPTPMPAAAALQPAEAPDAAAPVLTQPPPGPSLYARRLQAEIAARKQAKDAPPADDEPPQET